MCREELGSTRDAACILHFPTLSCSVNSVALKLCLLPWEECLCLPTECHEQDVSSPFLSNAVFNIYRGPVQTAHNQPWDLLCPEHTWWTWWEILSMFIIVSLWAVWNKNSTKTPWEAFWSIMAQSALILLNTKFNFNSLPLVGCNPEKPCCLPPANWILLLVPSTLKPMWFY